MESFIRKLATWLDVEMQLAADQSLSEAELLARDSRLATAVRDDLNGKGKPDRRAVILSWCRLVREKTTKNTRSLGQKFLLAVGVIQLGLIALGFLLGVAAIRLTLRYDGTEPVNVVHFLAVMVGVQIGLLLLLLLSYLLRHLWSLLTQRGVAYGNLLHELLRSIILTNVKIPSEINGIKRFQSLHKSALNWQLLILTQSFGVAFNLAALGSLIYFVSFTDLAFSWSTSLRLTPEEAHAVIKAIAWPWHSLGGGYIPSLDLVEKTQYFRIDGRYMAADPNVRTTDVRLLGSWWPFLMMAVAVYGLLPRVCLYLLGKLGFARAVLRIGFDSLAIDTVLARLGFNAGGWEPFVGDSESRESSKNAEKIGAQELSSITVEKYPYANQDCDVVIWRDVPLTIEQIATYLASEHQLKVVSVVKAGGTEVSGKRLTVVVAEAWESPGKAVIHMLKELRQKLGPQQRLLVQLVLLSGDQGEIIGVALPAQRQLWRQELAKLNDANLGLQP